MEDTTKCNTRFVGLQYIRNRTLPRHLSMSRVSHMGTQDASELVQP